MEYVWVLEEMLCDCLLGDNFEEFEDGKICFSTKEKALAWMEKFCLYLIHEQESDLKDLKRYINLVSAHDNYFQWEFIFFNDEEEYFTSVSLQCFPIN